MNTPPTMHPLKYIAAALVQMASMLRDFDMPDSAQLLEQVRADIEARVADTPGRKSAKK